MSVGALVAVKFLSLPVGISQSLSTSGGSDQALWQVQTTFLSVGFAGLAIAAQLFTEAPLAIGASRSRVLEHVKADWFVGVGLVGNIVIALEVIWLQSDLGVLIVALVWFIPTLIMLIVSTMRLLQLFSNPSRLDELVKMSLTNNLTTRLNVVAQKYADAKQVLQNLQDPLNSTKLVNPSMRVPVPEAGRVIRMIRPKIVQQAINSLGLRATEHHDVQSDPAKMYHPPQIVIDIEPGDRTRFGETAFRVISSDQLESERARRIALLYSPASSLNRQERLHQTKRLIEKSPV